MSPKLYQQIECVDDDSPDGPPDFTSPTLVVFVETGRVKAGDRVKFKETGLRWWKVKHVYQQTVSELNRGWGLDLPKSQRTER